MKKFILVIASTLLLIAFGYKASAQYYFYDNNSYDTPLMFELGGSFGIMNYYRKNSIEQKPYSRMQSKIKLMLLLK